MRLRTAAVSAGIAALAVTGLAVPAQAAPHSASGWTNVAAFTTKSACIDAGQQYEREGWNAYKCTLGGGYPPYLLWIE